MQRFLSPNDANIWSSAVISALGQIGSAPEAIEAADAVLDAFRERMPAEQGGEGRIAIPNLQFPKGRRQ